MQIADHSQNQALLKVSKAVKSASLRVEGSDGESLLKKEEQLPSEQTGIPAQLAPERQRNRPAALSLLAESGKTKDYTSCNGNDCEGYCCQQGRCGEPHCCECQCCGGNVGCCDGSR